MPDEDRYLGGALLQGRSGQHVFKLVVWTGASEIFLHHLTNDVASSSFTFCPAPPPGRGARRKLSSSQCFLSTHYVVGPLPRPGDSEIKDRSRSPKALQGGGDI